MASDQVNDQFINLAVEDVDPRPGAEDAYNKMEGYQVPASSPTIGSGRRQKRCTCLKHVRKNSLQQYAGTRRTDNTPRRPRRDSVAVIDIPLDAPANPPVRPQPYREIGSERIGEKICKLVSLVAFIVIIFFIVYT